MVDALDAFSLVQNQQDIRGGVIHTLELFRPFDEFDFHFPALGQIVQHGQHRFRKSVLVLEQGKIDFHRSTPARLGDQIAFDGAFTPAFQSRSKTDPDVVEPLGGDKLREFGIHETFKRQIQQTDETGIGVEDGSVRSEHGQTVMGRIKKGLVPLSELEPRINGS